MNTSRLADARAGVNPGVAGSAYIELGKTKVIASAYAPSERTAGADFSAEATFECQAQYAPFSLRPRLAPPEIASLDRALSISVEQALRPAVLLDRFPKSALSVFVVVLQVLYLCVPICWSACVKSHAPVQADGGEHSAAVAGAALALADAGIDVIDIAASVTVGHYVTTDTTTRLIVDPSADELSACVGNTVVSMLPRLGRLTLVAHTGRAPASAFTAAMQRSMQGCLTISTALRAAVVDSTKRRAKASVKSKTSVAATANPTSTSGVSSGVAGTTNDAPMVLG